MIVDQKDGRCRTCDGTLQIIDADDSTMTTNDFPHAFAQIARTTPNIQNALATRQIELPKCFQSLRNDVPCEIDVFKLFRGFTGEFEPGHFRLHRQWHREIERES